MKNWKVILQSNLFFLILTIILIFYCFFTFFIPKTSKYLQDEKKFEGKITEYKIDGNILSMVIKAKEKLQVFYKIETLEEKEALINTVGYGKKVRIHGNLEIPSENTIPNTFNYKKYLYYEKIHYVLNATTIEVIGKENVFYFIKNMIQNYLKKLDYSEYFLAFLLGNTKEYNLTNLRVNGVSHLFAVSGMHVALFVSIFEKFAKKTKKGKFLFSLFLCFYAFLVGFTPSILRVVLFYFFKILNQNVHLSSKRLFFFLFYFLLFINPFYLKNMGFQYSFSIHFSFLFLKQRKSYFHNLWNMSLIAFLVSIPITAMNFYEINLTSLFLNMILVPFVSLILYPCSFVVILFPFFLPLYGLFIKLFECLNSIFANTFACFIVIPSTSMLLWIFYYLFLFFFLNTNRKRYFGFLILVLFLIKIIPKVNPNTYVYFLDVGQGDSMLLVNPHQKETVLIDTGGKLNYVVEEWKQKKNKMENTLITFLHSLGLNQIDFLILTHGDYDHMGDAINLIEAFNFEKVIFNCGNYNDLEKELISILKKKKINSDSCMKDLSVGNSKFYFLNTKNYDNENDNSNVIFTEFNGYKFLLLGDASTNTENEILDKYNLPNIDVLKVGHHGSKTSSGKEFIKSINPKYSVISVGKNNRYGHPNKEVLNNLEDSKIYRTDINGTILFQMKKGKLDIRTCPP